MTQMAVRPEEPRVQAETPGITIADLMPLVSCRIGRKAHATGHVSRGPLSAGPAPGMADRIEPMADIIARIQAQAVEAQARLAETAE